MLYLFCKLADLKNRARRIARDEKVPRQAAHDLAAVRGGFQNYAHARRILPDGEAPGRHLVEVRQRWRERDPRRTAVASLMVPLSLPLAALLRPHHLVSYLSGCGFGEMNVLLSDGFMRDLEETRMDLGKIGRALQFIDVTGLRPSSAKRIYPNGSWYNRPPIADHDHGWFDPEARVHILSTEPYRDDGDRRPEQVVWGSEWNWTTLRSDWGSIYGLGTTLYLCCPNAYAPVLRAKLDALTAGSAAVGTDEILIEDPYCALPRERGTMPPLASAQR
jgi:hypothetical protein